MKLFKFVLDIECIHPQVLHMDPYGEVVSVQMQGEDLCIWVIGDHIVKTPRTFQLYWTGEEIYEDVKYIGTIQVQQNYVLHLMEVLNAKG